MNIDVNHEAEPWQPHLQILHRQFYDHARDCCLLWVNPAQADPFAEDPLVEARKVRVPIQHANFDVVFAPYLVPLDLGKSSDADIFKPSVAMGWSAWELDSLQAFNGQPIGGWIATDQPAPILAKYWAVNCHLHHVNGLTKLLRFHDPSAREWLWYTLTPDQQARLLGPARWVAAFNRQQGLMTHAVTAGAPETHDSLGTFQLTPTQWGQINDYAVVHAAWLRWRSAVQNAASGPASSDTWEQAVLHALRAASAYGIDDRQGRESFAFHALQLGTHFHEHARMLPVWEKTRAGDHYGAACEDVSGQPSDRLHVYLHSK
jgi:hypothetical protein